LTEEEYFTVCLKGYMDLIKNGVTFVSDSGLSDRKPDYLAKAIKLLGIRGVLDVEGKINQYINNIDEGILYTGHLPEEEDITMDKLEECKSIIEKYNKPIMMTHCLENIGITLAFKIQ
jgi:5-methylthioadenosine/S-adenosylhomocysteine deaminase